MEYEGVDVSLLTLNRNILSFKELPYELINLVCRICLAKSSFESIFAGNHIEMITAFTTVKISKGDGLPSQICSDCIVKIKQAYIFKKLVEKCDFVLKQRYLLYNATMSTDKSIKSSVDLKQSLHEDSEHDYNLVGKCSEDEYREPIKNDLEDDCDIEIVKHEIKEEVNVIDPAINIEEVQNSETSEHLKGNVDNLLDVSVCDINSKQRDLNYIPSNDYRSSKRGHDDFNNSELSPQPDVSTEKRIIGTGNNKMTYTRARKYICPICGKKWICQYDLNTHMRIHTGEKPYKCEFIKCGRGFATKSNLTAHESLHSGIEMKDGIVRNHACSICGKKLISLSHLKVHMRIHTGEKPYKCEFTNCGKSFPSNSNLNSHKLSHTGSNGMKNARPQNYVCSICGKNWISSSKLKNHMRTHIAKKSYKCEISNVDSNGFQGRSNLNAHIGLHGENYKIEDTRLRKHVCLVCEKKWVCQSDLNTHMRVHTGERPYKCEVTNCGKSFTTRSNLSTHRVFHIGTN